ncbi:hypothetical protein TrVE_jg10376 [Triparma verrucosa]|uniref:Dihydroorotate dehydrogenase (quinone), mitochondrial n=1 Tax=Triparma verrucosa TaxID=1606542 RepID=A0A9W7FI08_9STRA|nr:hypothetical protein TrVE_jg10376 [Triparma verrucosa]
MAAAYIRSRIFGGSRNTLVLTSAFLISTFNPDDYAGIRSTSFYRTLSDDYATPLLRKILDGEQAHAFAIKAVKYAGVRDGDTFGHDPTTSSFLSVILTGRKSRKLSLRNCVMLSAGFDKDAEAIVPLLAAGFGAVEIGSVTPEPQSGNPKPRVFRLLEDSGVINRYGFNSSGHSAVKSNLKSSLHSLSQIRSYHSLVSGSEGSIGVNLGKNTLSPSAVHDYTRGIRSLGPLSSYIVINVSCPNIKNLTKLQDDLKPLLDECCKVRDDVCERKMIFVKVGPDLNDEGIKKISEVIINSDVDGIIVSNTSSSLRSTLKSPHSNEKGGLSGTPIKNISTKSVQKFSEYLTPKGIPIIGVGGIFNSEDALEKIHAGASAVQVYTGLTYRGLGIVKEIKEGIVDECKRKGVDNFMELKGKE